MRSSARRDGAPTQPARPIAGALLLILLLAGCAREAPEVREVRTASKQFLGAASRKDVKEISERSTCFVSTNTLVGGNVLAIESPHRFRFAILDSLAKVSMRSQRVAESTWAYADETTADSLFRLARRISVQATVYRNASRAVMLSTRGGAVGPDSIVETRIVRARVRYAGPVVGPRPVDKEEILRLIRVPWGSWIVFSMYLVADDPRPEMI